MGYKLADGSGSEQYKIGDEVKVIATNRKLRDDMVNSDIISGDHRVVTEISGDSIRLDDLQFGWLNVNDVIKPFTKSDLKDGMRIEMMDSGGHAWYKSGQRLTSDTTQEYCSLDQFEDDLTCNVVSDCDIIKVTDRDGSVVFERVPMKRKITIELTDDQIESLKQQGIID